LIFHSYLHQVISGISIFNPKIAFEF